MALVRPGINSPTFAERQATVTRSGTMSAVNQWGRLPLIALSTAVGLLLVASADTGARTGAPWADMLFWEGLLIVFVPIVIRLFSANAERQERIGLVVQLGLALYLIKALHSPSYFTFTDELIHWRTASDILQRQHLFIPNPLLPATAYYPGLEIVTSALASLTGLSIFTSGIVVVGVGRFVMALALFLIFEQISGSDRAAGIAAMLYMTNNNFLFFNGEYSYESLALPIAMVALLAILQRSRASQRQRWTFLVLLTIAATVFTHHITSFMLLAFLALWAAATYGRQALRDALANHEVIPNTEARGVRRLVIWTRNEIIHQFETNTTADRPPINTILIMAVAAISWMVIAATQTIRYIAIPAWNGANQFAQLFTGESTSRQLFQDFTGMSAPLWERAVGFAAIGLVCLAIPAGFIAIWKYRRNDALMLSCIIGAAAYPFMQLLRLNASAWEIASRVSEFLFLAVALVIAVGIVHFMGKAWKGLLVFAAYCTVLMVGGLASGWPYWARLPQPYLVSADTRSVDPQSMAAAEWAGQFLPPGNRIGSDRINRLLMSTYGRQDALTNADSAGTVAWIFMSDNFGPSEANFIHDKNVKYLVVDHRLSTALPVVGIYFEKGEPDTNNHSTPLQLSWLTKFDNVPQITRPFDGGSIVIYNVGGVSGDH